MKSLSNQQTALRVILVTICWNIALTAIKILAGLWAHSTAMISDAVHSASDVFSTLIVLFGIKMAHKAPDQKHPYGHERMECVAALLLAILLAFTGIGICYNGLQKIFAFSSNAIQDRILIPGGIAIAAALLSIIVKETMYWYTRAAANRIHSSALLADACHHRSDALSSVGSLLGILGARLGYPLLDPLAAAVISCFILKSAIVIFLDAIAKMTDRACDEQLRQSLLTTIRQQPGVLGVDLLNTRLFGDKIYVEVEICADGNLSLEQTHQTAHQVHDRIEQRFPQVKHCTVHVNPFIKQLCCKSDHRAQ